MSSHGRGTPQQISQLITAGRVLLLAGDARLLAKLPAGTWLGGSSVPFKDAGVPQADAKTIFYTDLTDDVTDVRLAALDAEALPQLAEAYPENGFCIIILPGLSDILSAYAANAPDYPGIFNAPLTGWVSGAAGNETPLVFAGTPQGSFIQAAVMYAALPDNKAARLDIINLFSPAKGAKLVFEAGGYSATTCKINGESTNLAAYLAANSIDSRLPLLADYNGAMINVAIRQIDAETVYFYGPLCPSLDYHFSSPLPDYRAAFIGALAEFEDEPPAFSCNCILNYRYAALEKENMSPFIGPVTFGEIAYTLLNQTLVYLTIDTIEE